jgi:hypothetical protein
MTIFLTAALKPLVFLLVYIPLMAAGVWATKRFLPDGKLKRLLLTKIS